MALTYVPVPAFAGALTAANAALYTVGGSVDASIVKEILLNNSDSQARTVTLYAVPSGDSAGQAYEIFSQAIDPGLLRIPLTTVLSPGDSIQGFADKASLVSCRISAAEGA